MITFPKLVIRRATVVDVNLANNSATLVVTDLESPHILNYHPFDIRVFKSGKLKRKPLPGDFVYVRFEGVEKMITNVRLMKKGDENAV